MSYSKPCKKCGQTKPLTDFHKNPLIKDGHKNSCKECESLHYKIYREKNPRVVTKEQKERWGRNRLLNTPSEDSRAASREWYYKNKDRHRAAHKKYLSKNPGLNASYVSKYQARKRGNGVFDIRKKELKRLRLGPCFYCGENKSRMTIDHIIPIKRGGTHSIGNLVSACGSCNSSKRDKFITEWKKTRKIQNATN